MNKYHARKVLYDGIWFDSGRERDRYIALMILQRGKYIQNLRRQVPFQLLPPIYEERVVQLKTKTKIEKRLVQKGVNYIADFVYERDGKTIVEDTKGYRTKDYILKKKMMRALLGIDINEI